MMKGAMSILLAGLLVCGLCFGGNPEQAGASQPGNNAVQTLPESRFGEALRQYISARLGKDINDIIVSRLTVAANKSLPAGEVSLQIIQKVPGELNGYVRLVALVRVNNVPCSEVQLSGWIDVFDAVVCASRHLDKGTIITRNDIHLAQKNISRLRDNILTDMNQAIGLTLSQDVKENEGLKDWMLKRTPVVNRGDMVTILADGAGIKVTVPGRILEKGFLGEYVRVQNTMSRRNIFAKVVNDSTVLVDF